MGLIISTLKTLPPSLAGVRIQNIFTFHTMYILVLLKGKVINGSLMLTEN